MQQEKEEDRNLNLNQNQNQNWKQPRVQKLIEKNGIKFVKIGENIIKLTFEVNNDKIVLPLIINFDLIKLVNTLNPNIVETTEIINISDIEITMSSLLKDIFCDLGLAQYYLALKITKEIIDPKTILFNCVSFNNKLQSYPDDVEKLPVESMNIKFNIINNHKFTMDFDIILIDQHNIPQFSEKIIGNLIYNMFNRLKQFIENITF